MEKKIRLLFVDDEEKFLANMATRLRLRDIEVSAFHDSREAFAEIEAGRRFDVALLDLKMPGLDGEELLKLIKASDPTVEVVILTGHGSVQSAASLTRSGAYEYLPKPCELTDVIRAITSAFSKRVTATSAAHAERVEEVMSRAVGLSPLEILGELKRIQRA